MNDLDDYLSKLSERVATQFQTVCDKLSSPRDTDILRQLTALKYLVFYSNPYHTLKRGRFYLMGLNPGGGDKDRAGKPIHYDDETPARWQGMKAEYPYGKWRDDDKKTQLQERVCILIEEIQRCLGEKTIGTEHVFSANLYFIRTPGEKPLNLLLKRFANNLNCWPIHQEFLSKVCPHTVITFGLSTFWKVSQHLEPPSRGV